MTKLKIVTSVCGALALTLTACAEDPRPAPASEAPRERAERARPAPTPADSSREPIMTQVAPVRPSAAPAGAAADEPEREPPSGSSETWPEGFEARMRAAAENAARGAGDEALALYGAASKLRPGHAMPYIEKARVLIGMGYHGRARTHAERGVELYPSSSLAWNTLGRVELGEGDLEAAVAAFRRAAEVNEDNSYAWNNLGLSLLELGRYGEAADALEIATSGLEPEAFMWNNLGMTYEHLGQLDRARAAYRQGMHLGSARAETNLDRLEGVLELPSLEGDEDPEAGSAKPGA
jgi:tetratricopeptide (TPR) repeat protein